MDIKEHGTTFNLDEDGYIINHLSLNDVQSEWKEAVDDTAELCKKQFGEKLQSVYIRGSVAAGKAIPQVSDIDLILVFRNTPEELKETLNNIKENIEDRHKDLVAKIDLDYTQADDIRKPLKIMLKTQSLCVYGKDISQDLPSVHISEAHQHKERIRKEIESTLEDVEDIEDGEKLRKKEQWIFSRLIRALYEHVMPEKGIYTRSLYYNYKYFSEYYPEHKDDVYTFLEHAINPTGGKEEIKERLNKGLEILKGTS